MNKTKTKQTHRKQASGARKGGRGNTEARQHRGQARGRKGYYRFHDIIMPVKLLKSLKHYRMQRIIQVLEKFLIKKKQRQPGYSKREKKSQPAD